MAEKIASLAGLAGLEADSPNCSVQSLVEYTRGHYNALPIDTNHSADVEWDVWPLLATATNFTVLQTPTSALIGVS